MDDFVGGDESDNSVFEMSENLKSSFKSGGFNMRKWISNSEALQERIEQSESQSSQVTSNPNFQFFISVNQLLIFS